MKSSIHGCFLYVLVSSHATLAHGGDLADRYAAFAIQGDLRPARALFSEAPFSDMPAEQELARRFRERFVERSEVLSPGSGNALIDDIVTIYRTYWIDALLPGNAPEVEARTLEVSLANALQAHGWQRRAGVPASDVYHLLANAVESAGFYALIGPAPPLQDLLLWRNHAESQFTVELTDQERAVSVIFTSDFYSRGWKHFAALGLATTAGWIDEGKLYCADRTFDRGTEAFAVSYLKHESRHLADYEFLPGLAAADLEYRAKLTELAFASTTLRSLLEDFTAKGVPNPEIPHAMANYRVTQDLYRELYGRPFPGNAEAWMTLDAARVNRVARRLLRRDTESRH